MSADARGSLDLDSKSTIQCRDHGQRGFTLIELMTVLLIVALLTAFAYPSYRGVKLKTMRAEGHAALMRLMQQQERHFSEAHRYRLLPDDNEGGAAFRLFSGETLAGSAYRLDAVACEGFNESGGAGATAGQPGQNCILLRATPLFDTGNGARGILTLDSNGKSDDCE
jgi:type IV pilus assembly protein PilE